MKHHRGFQWKTSKSCKSFWFQDSSFGSGPTGYLEGLEDLGNGLALQLSYGLYRRIIDLTPKIFTNCPYIKPLGVGGWLLEGFRLPHQRLFKQKLPPLQLEKTREVLSPKLGPKPNNVHTKAKAFSFPKGTPKP